MTTNISLLLNNHLTDEEVAAFAIVDDVFKHLYDLSEGHATLTSTVTGELVEVSEIPRIRGALSCVVENVSFELH